MANVRGKPIAHDQKGWPIFAYSERDGKTPVCGKRSQSGHVCQDKRRHENGRCWRPAHGGPGSGTPPTTGEYTKAMRTRKEFIAALAGNETETAHQLVEKLHQIALGGNLEAIKYCLDQLFGSAKSTHVNEIGDRAYIAATIKITAKHLTGDAFTAWLTDLKAELAEALD